MFTKPLHLTDIGLDMKFKFLSYYPSLFWKFYSYSLLVVNVAFLEEYLLVQMVESLPAVWETWVDPWVWEIPGRKKWQPTPVFLSADSAWTEEPGGLQSTGPQRVGHD